MSKWGRQYILAENPSADIPEDASIEFVEDNWLDNSYGGCETCGDAGPSTMYEVHITYRPPRKPKSRSYPAAITRTYRGSFGELIRDIVTWEDEQ